MEDIFTIQVSESVWVRKVQDGEALEETDFYLSSSGKYEPCPCPGVICQGGEFYRPISNE